MYEIAALQSQVETYICKFFWLSILCVSETLIPVHETVAGIVLNHFSGIFNLTTVLFDGSHFFHTRTHFAPDPLPLHAC